MTPATAAGAGGAPGRAAGPGIDPDGVYLCAMRRARTGVELMGVCDGATTCVAADRRGWVSANAAPTSGSHGMLEAGAAGRSGVPAPRNAEHDFGEEPVVAITHRRTPPGLSATFAAAVVGVGLAAASLVCLPAIQAQPSRPAGLVRAEGRALVRDGEPFVVRGVNYYPKDHAWRRFWLDYAAAATAIDAELDRAERLGVNTVRIFVPFDLFADGGSPHLAALRDFVDVRLARRGMLAIVTLFDLVADAPPGQPSPYAPAGRAASRAHARAVVGALGTGNANVLAWDVKNEIDRDYGAFGRETVLAWLDEMVAALRGLDPGHLVTVGAFGVRPGAGCAAPGTDGFDTAGVADLAGRVDFASVHYYLPERCFAADLADLRRRVGDKPIVLGEFGLSTARSPDASATAAHTETQQAAYYNALLSQAEAQGLAGAVFWTLNDFKGVGDAIPAGKRSAEQCMGVLRNARVDGCHVRSAADYAEKPAADTVERHFGADAAYLDLFDGWVDGATDAPPPGWADSRRAGGALLRGHRPGQALWSWRPGHVALAKWVAGGARRTGLVTAPLLVGVDVDRRPLLTLRVAEHRIRDVANGSPSDLFVAVAAAGRITRLLTVTPQTPLPATFEVDLRSPPLGWRGRRDVQVVLGLEPAAGVDGYGTAYLLDWLGLLPPCREIRGAQGGWAIDTCPTRPDLPRAMGVRLDGAPRGRAALVRVYHRAEEGPGMPQVAVVYASGFVRLKPNADPPVPVPFGSSFVLGPAHWTTREAGPSYHHSPQLHHAVVDTRRLPDGPLDVALDGALGDLAVHYALALPAPRDAQTRLHVDQSFTATRAITIPESRRAAAEGFKLAQISSMFIRPDGRCAGAGGVRADCHDMDAIAFVGRDGALRRVPLASFSTSGLLIATPEPLGSTWLDARHGDDDGWQGNTPNVRLALDALPAAAAGAIRAQGAISITTDPNDDNVGLWLHDDGLAAHAWIPGATGRTGYWLVASDDPPDPWADLGLRGGAVLRSFATFTEVVQCALVRDPAQSTRGLEGHIAGLDGAAMGLAYDLGAAYGNWVQLRCDFDPPLDLAAFDHLRLDWRGEAGAANSLEVGLVDRVRGRERVFGTGYPHVTHRAWWGQLVVPFDDLRPWEPGTVLDRRAIVAVVVAATKRSTRVFLPLAQAPARLAADPTATPGAAVPGFDAGGPGSLAIDNIGALALGGRAVPAALEAVRPNPVAAAAAVDWLVRQQRPSGLVESWSEEPGCLAHTYDQALALIAFSRAGRWREADAVVHGLRGAWPAGDGVWRRTYRCDGPTGTPASDDRSEGDVAWAVLALSHYAALRQRASVPGPPGLVGEALVMMLSASTWLRQRIEAGAGVDAPDAGCVRDDRSGAVIGTAETLAVWWALRSAGEAFAPEAARVQACVLRDRWDGGLGRFKGARDDARPQLDSQTWGSAFLRAVGRDADARRALSYARDTLRLPAQGGQVHGFDGLAGPWAVWNDGAGQYAAAGGEGANAVVAELVAQQRRDGAVPGGPDAFAGGGVWVTRWHGVGPTAWLYFALTEAQGDPFEAVP